jgi:hypothetical protein
MSPPDQPTDSAGQPSSGDDGAVSKTDVEVTSTTTTIPKNPSVGVAHADHAEPDHQTATPAAAIDADNVKPGNESFASSAEAASTDRQPSPPVTATTTAKGKGKLPEKLVLEDMSASTATVKPGDLQQQYLAPDPASYIDPTPPTPRNSQPPSRTPSNARSHPSDHSPSRTDTEDEDKRYMSEDDQDRGSTSEIQSIMDQFSESGGGPGAEEVMSPRLEIASPMLGSPNQHPPRRSSLEPLSASFSGSLPDFKNLHIAPSSPASVRSRERLVDDSGPPVPPKDGDGAGGSLRINTQADFGASITSPVSTSAQIHRPPPPEPEPEPALPFDFHRFLEQLRNKKADPVARYLKSFLSEFGKRQWMVHEQVKIIGDFLAFIANKMAQCEVWRDVSDAEFDNAREGMEKLVMNRLYSQTFSPAIPPPKPIPGSKPKRKGADTPMGPGRRGQHQEDVERDDIAAQKINIYGWVREEHLDIPTIGDSGRRFLKLAQQELLKIKSYRAPRDKIICVLNCCKVIFGLLKHNKSDSSADSFMPLLIYVVLQANPEHLVSNVQYILRFRNQDKLGGEAGYYLSSLMGAIQFIENMDRTTLTITDDEFEKNVEAAVSAIAEKHQAMSPTSPVQPPVFNEKTGLVPNTASSGPSMDGQDASGPSRRSNDGVNNEDGAAIAGLLRTFQKPLSTIGRIFSDDGGASSSATGAHSQRAEHESLPPRPPHPGDSQVRDSARRPSSSKHNLSAEEAAARQASAEAAEAERLTRAEHANVVETLAGMFPDLDKDIISDVVYQKEGRVGLAVDACLALST